MAWHLVLVAKSSPQHHNGGLALTGKTPVLKTGGLAALGVRVPHPPLNWQLGFSYWLLAANGEELTAKMESWQSGNAADC